MKLHRLGIHDQSIAWFKHYLEGRHQCVRYNRTLSLPSPIKCGVPQGSLLGPVRFLALIHDLPTAMGIDPFPSLSGGTVGYGDDVVVWISGPSVEVVKPVIESTATSEVAYMANNCMALNPEKTQVLWIGPGTTSPKVMIGNSLVSPVESIEFLGLKFNRDLKSDPHIATLNSAVVSLAGVARWLKVHLPSNLAADIVRALLVGRIGYGIAATFFPRLGCDDPGSALMSTLQVRVNDVAKVICGSSRTDSQSIASLLERSGLPSVNRLAVKSVAIEAWKSLGPQCKADVNPLTSLFGPPVSSCTRASNLGRRKPATKFPVKMFINVATTLWNSNQHLRSAASIGAAKQAASSLAEACPLWSLVLIWLCFDLI